MQRAIVAGHICLDVIPRFERAFEVEPGRLYEAGPATIATGGAVSNTGVAMHLLGVPVRLIGRIGRDAFGDNVLKVLQGYGPGLADGMRVVDGETTSYTLVVNIPGKDRTFLHCPGANHSFSAADVDAGAWQGAGLLHFGYPPYMRGMYAQDGQQLVELFRRAREEGGLTTSLDLGLPEAGGPSGAADWQAILARVLPHVDVFMPSADELLYALDRERFGQGDSVAGGVLSRLGERLLDLGVAVAGIKVGSRGMYIRTAGLERLQRMGRVQPRVPEDWANRELWFPVFQIPRFVGATGAGDTTIAGFLTAFMRGRGPVEAGRMANAVGSCNVQTPDALSGIRSWEETEKMLKQGWETDPLDPGSPEWICDGASGVRVGPNDATRRDSTQAGTTV